MRGADCNTDHRMVRAKVVVGKRKYFRSSTCGVGVRRWAVSGLLGASEDARGREMTRGRFLRGVRERVQNGCEGCNSVEEKWARMKNALCESAKAELGHEDRRQPDWFRESETDLRPLIAERNQLYALWLSTGKERDRKKFASARRETRSEKS